MVGKTLGKYRIVEKIGRGGMGVVYRGVDETLDRQVAIKAISPELVEEDLVRRFRAEAVTLAKVNHPNIATVYELFRDDDRLLMVMELVSGQTFEQVIDRTGPMPAERAASLTGQILDALGHAHSAGIVHRDLKPANLMLTDAGIVKVMDFGIARVSGTERMTNDGFMVGTPAYMAPEQVRGEDVDGRTDLYAVGVVFYRLLTGKLPFKAETAVAMIQSQLNAAPTPARQIRAELPDWLDAVLMRALEKNPADRYQNADEFRRALASLEPVGALSPSSMPDDVTVATPSAPVAAHTLGVRAHAAATPASAATPLEGSHSTTLVLNRSHLAVAGGFGAMLLLVIALLAWVALRRTPAPVQIVNVPAVAQPPAAPPAPVVTAPPTPAAPAIAPPPPATAAPITPPLPAAAGAIAPPPAAAVVAPKATPAKTQAARPAAPAAADVPAAPKTAAVVPSAEALPPSARGGRGRAASGASDGRGARGPVPNGDFAPVVIHDLNALAVLPKGNRVMDALVAFSEKSITASETRNGLTIRTFPYAAVTNATLSRSRRPRGKGGATLEVPGGIPEGNIFARGPRLWVTIETADDRLVLRIEPQQVRPIFDLLGERTRASIERYMEPEP